MTKNKMSDLQNALKSDRSLKVVAVENAVPHEPRPLGIAPSRVGKTNITAYLHKDYKKNLRLIQAKTIDKSFQDLVAEALNDLFLKYDVPQIDYE